MSDAPRTKPLDGIRVLDIATLVAAPFASASMAEFGAEVIKLEKPGEGDTLRRLGTPSAAGDTYWWMSDGRNKRCATLDLRQPEGAALFRQLVAKADIVMENFRPGTLERWGLGYDALAAINPGIILLRVSGYGQTGPKASDVGVARIAEGFAGTAYLTGEPDGRPLLGGASALADYVTGLYGAYGAMLALRERDRSGKGQMIDLALYDGLLRFLDELAPHHGDTGAVRERMGAETHRSVPHSNYPTGDGQWVSIACTNDLLFTRLASAMGQPECEQHPRFATNAARIEHRDLVNARVEEWTRAHPLAEIVRACAAAGVPCGPIMSIADMAQDEHYRARGSFRTVADHRSGPLRVVDTVPRLSATPGGIDHLGRALAQDNDYVFRELLGLAEDELAALTARGII